MRSLSREVVGRSVAVERGAEIIRRAGLDNTASVPAKGAAGDYVTDVDLAAERAIAEVLATEGGDVGVHGEESGGESLDDAWIVDPLDGTTNFAHGFWAVGVSVALVRRGIAGGRGRLRAVPRSDLGRRTWRGSLARASRARPGPGSASRTVPSSARWWPPGSRSDARSSCPGTCGPSRQRSTGSRISRRPGAAALDLAWVAAGVFDGFFELGLSPWDVAAGGLLVEEAGGTVSDWDGGPDWLAGDIVAGPVAVQQELRRVIGSALETT